MSVEAKIESKLVKRVKEVGGWCIKLLPTFITGIPDRLCLFPGGLMVFIEVKAPGEKPRKTQLVVHRKLKNLGFEVLILDNKNDINLIINKYAH